jgi:hypothetical protein
MSPVLNRTPFYSVLVGAFIFALSLLGARLFGLESDHAGYVVGESIFEGFIVGGLFFLWRNQISLRTREAETYARALLFRNQLIRDHLQLIAFRCELDPAIQRNVREISRLLDDTPAAPDRSAAPSAG